MNLHDRIHPTWEVITDKDDKSLRDYFAGQALAAFADGWHQSNFEDLAATCYKAADAMLAQRLKERAK